MSTAQSHIGPVLGRAWRQEREQVRAQAPAQAMAHGQQPERPPEAVEEAEAASIRQVNICITCETVHLLAAAAAVQPLVRVQAHAERQQAAGEVAEVVAGEELPLR